MLDRSSEATTFQDDGVVVLRQVLTEDEVEQLRAGIDRVMAAPGPLAISTGTPGEPGTFFEDFCRWSEVAEFERVIRESKLAALAGELTSSSEIRLFHDHTLVKEPATASPTPWHQDQPYYCIDGRQTVSFWIPLDPVPRESTLEFVRGSHEGTWYMPRSFVQGTAMVFDEGMLEDVPDIEADRDAFDIVGWDLEPGDAVSFNMLTLHASAGSANRRRAFSLRLMGDDVRFSPRPHPTSPNFPGLADELGAGQQMDHPLFPVLWRASKI